MIIPDEFSGRIFKVRNSRKISLSKEIFEIIKSWPGSEMEVIYEGAGPNIVAKTIIIFETQEDCTAFTLQHGHKYG